MSVKVSFYTNNSDNRQMLKDLTLLSQSAVVCDIYEPTDIINPILFIDKDLVSLTDTNYCYIEEFGRYYFITDISGEAGNIARFACHVDVLQTYNDEIRACPMIAARSTNHYNMYLQDGKRLFKTYAFDQYINIGSELGPPDRLVLITM